jgi:hypothetical protein
MALGVNSSEVASVTFTGDAGSATLNIPSGVNAAVVFSVFFTATSLADTTGVTLNTSTTPDVTVDLYNEELATGGMPIGAFIFWNPPTGASVDLDLTQNNKLSDGSVMAVYIDDCDTTLRASGVSHDISAATPETVSLTSLTSGDLIISFLSNYDDTNPPILQTSPAYTSLQTDTSETQVSARLSSYSTTGTSETVQNEGTSGSTDNPGVVGLAFAPAAAGGPISILVDPAGTPY